MQYSVSSDAYRVDICPCELNTYWSFKYELFYHILISEQNFDHLLQVSVDVGPCELFHFLLSDLVKHLQKEEQFQTGEF